jgi:hypothetical protein
MSRLDRVHAFRRIPPKHRLRARLAHGDCIKAERGDIAAEAWCLQNACNLESAEDSEATLRRREVAGSSPVAPAEKALQIGMSVGRSGHRPHVETHPISGGMSDSVNGE